jgi:hypothetical protein
MRIDLKPMRVNGINVVVGIFRFWYNENTAKSIAKTV